MKFCEKCGAYMRATKDGLECTKCKYKVLSESIEVKTLAPEETPPIVVVSDSTTERVVVNEPCPKCENSEALRNMSFISGEHAGVRQERSVERFTCTKCGHVWTKQ